MLSNLEEALLSYSRSHFGVFIVYSIFLYCFQGYVNFQCPEDIDMVFSFILMPSVSLKTKKFADVIIPRGADNTGNQ